MSHQLSTINIVNYPSKYSLVHNFISTYLPDICVITETHCTASYAHSIFHRDKSLPSFYKSHFISANLVGRQYSGLGVIWKHKSFIPTAPISRQSPPQLIPGRVVLIPGILHLPPPISPTFVLLIAVYLPHDPLAREGVLDCLRTLIANYPPSPLLWMGDFNMTRAQLQTFISSIGHQAPLLSSWPAHLPRSNTIDYVFFSHRATDQAPAALRSHCWDLAYPSGEAPLTDHA